MKIPRPFTRPPSIPSLLFLTALSLPAAAQDYDWAIGVSGTWGSPVFWSPSSGFPNGPGTTARLSVNADFGNAYDVILDGNYSVDAFTHIAGDASFQVNNRTFTVNGPTNYSGGSMIFNRANYVTNGVLGHVGAPFDLISSSITGSGSYTHNGSLRMENSAIRVPTISGGGVVMIGSNTFNDFNNVSGTIDLFGPTDVGQNTTLSVGNTFHLENSGAIVMRTGPALAFVPNIGITGGGRLSNYSAGSIDIQAGVGGTRTLDVELNNQGPIASNATVTTSASGAAHVNSGPIIFNSGDWSITAMESLANSNLLQLTLGDLSLTGNNSATSSLANTSIVSAGGTLAISNLRTIDNDGTLSSGGNMTVTGTSNLAPVIFDHAGTVSVGPGGQFTMTTATAASQLIIQPGSTFTPGSALTLNNVNLVLNQDVDLGSADFNQTGGRQSGPGTFTTGPGSIVNYSAPMLFGPVVQGGTATFSGFGTTAGGFINNGSATLATGATLNINSNGFTNNGTFHMAAGPSGSNLESNTGQVFTNSATGSFTVADTARERSIRLSFDNQGDALFEAPVFLNLAHTEHRNSGTLTANDPVSTNATESFDNSGTLNANAPFSIDGNDLDTSVFTNSGTINSASTLAVSDFENATNSGLLNVTGGTTTVTVNSINSVQRFTNAGDIEVAPGASFALTSGWGTGPATFADGATLDGGGTINITTMGVTLDGPWSIGSSTLNAISSTIAGTGPFIVPPEGTFHSNACTVSAPAMIEGPTTFSGFSTASGGYTNNGEATLANGATLNVNANDFTNHGTFTLAAGSSGSKLESNTGQTFTNGPTGTLAVLDTTRERSIRLNFDNQGSAVFDAPVFLNLANTEHRNSGTFTANDPLSTNATESFDNSGTLNANASFSLDGNDLESSFFTNSGTINSASTLAIIDFENATNSGLLNITAGTTTVTVNSINNVQRFTNAGDIEVAPGATFNLTSGWGRAPATFEEGSTLDGGGAINFTAMGISLEGPLSIGSSSLTAFSNTNLGGPGPLQIPAAGTLTVSGSTVSTQATSEGSVTFIARSTASGGFISNGPATLANGATLNVNGNDFTNNGIFTMEAGNSSSALESNTGQTFTNGPTGTLSVLDTTRERSIRLNFDNQGSAGFDAPVFLNLANTEHRNSGTFTANDPLSTNATESFDNSGTLDLNATTTFDGNDSETSLFANHGTLNSAASLSIIDFENATNSGLLNITAGTTTVTVNSINNVQRFTNAGDIEVAPGATFNLTSGWGGAPATFEEGSTLDGGGAINFTAMGISLEGPLSIGSSSLTAFSNTNLGGPGPLQIPAAGTLTVSGSTVSTQATSEGSVTFIARSTASGGFISIGPATLANGATLHVNDNDFTNNGTFTMEAGNSSSALESNTGQTFTNGPTGTLAVLDTTRERSIRLNFDNQGSAVFDAPVFLNLANTEHRNSGTFTANDPLSTNATESFDNSGTLDLNATTSFDGNDSETSLFANSGTLNSAASLSIIDFEDIVNGGLLNITAGIANFTLGSVNNPQFFTNFGEVRTNPGTALTFTNGRGGSSVTNELDGRFTGSGTVNTTTLPFINKGTIAPGESTGLLTFSQGFTCSPDSKFEIELASAAGPGTGHDQLVVNGNLTLAGTLEPQLLGGFAPVPSDSFVVIKTVGGELTGTFDVIEQPFAPSGIFNVTVDETLDQVVITFTGSGPLNFDDFRTLHFTAEQIANGDADPDADFDRDGLSTFAEWVHGFDPTRSVRAVAPLRIKRDEENDLIELTFAQSLNLPEGSVTIALLTSPDGDAAFGPIPEGDYQVLPPVTIPGITNIQLVTLRLTTAAWSTGPLRLFRLKFMAVPP